MDLNSYQQFTGLESRCSHSMENQAIERGERSVCHHVYLETLNCIIKRSCIPCLYKLFPEGGKDVALAQVGTVALSGGIEVDHELLKRISLPCNQRPEQCPRSKPSPEVQSNTLYSPSTGQTKIAGAPTSILTVGDGDFTFSLSLATLLRTKEGSNQMEITATSHESQQSVLTTYKPHSQETLAQLKALGATVLHGVDATDLANTPELCKSSKHKKRKHDDDVGDDINTSDKVKMKRHDVVVWNFPCISLPAGADGQARELQANKELLAKFFANVRRCLTKGTGEVHISHKTIEPFSWWGMRQIAAENGFDFAYAVVFDRYVLHFALLLHRPLWLTQYCRSCCVNISTFTPLQNIGACTRATRTARRWTEKAFLATTRR